LSAKFKNSKEAYFAEPHSMQALARIMKKTLSGSPIKLVSAFYKLRLQVLVFEARLYNLNISLLVGTPLST
jgi:hypothetical protein